MRDLKWLTWLAAALVATGAVGGEPPRPDRFQIDPVHSSVTFSVKHLMISNIKGYFRKFVGKWRIDSRTGVLQELEGTVRADTIDTHNAKRDAHLRKSEFFNTDQNRDLTIKMLSYAGDGRQGRLKADVTIRGVTQPVAFEVRISPAIMDPTAAVPTCKQAITLSGVLNRFDFKVGQNYARAIIGEDVNVTLDLEGECPPAAPAVGEKGNAPPAVPAVTEPAP